MAEIVTNYTPEVWTPGSKLTAAQMTALSAAVDQVEETVKEKLDVDVPVSQFVGEKVAALVNSAPETLDTLGELANALQEKQEAVEALNGLVTANKTAIDGKTSKLINIKSVGSTKIDHDGTTAYVTSVDSNAMGSQGAMTVESQTIRVEVSEKHKDGKKVSSVQLSKDELRLIRRNAEGTIFSVEVADIDKAIKAIPTLATTEQLNGKIDTTTADEKYAVKSHKHVVADITDLQDKLDEKLNASEAFTKEAAGKLYADKSHAHAIANVEGLQAALDGKQQAGEYATVAQLGEKVANAEYQNDKKTFALKSELAGKLDSASAFKQSDADKLYVKVGDAFTQVKADDLYVKVGEAFTQVAADKLYALVAHNHDTVYVKKSDYDAKIRALEARLTALESPKP